MVFRILPNVYNNVYILEHESEINVMIGTGSGYDSTNNAASLYFQLTAATLAQLLSFVFFLLLLSYCVALVAYKKSSSRKLWNRFYAIFRQKHL